MLAVGCALLTDPELLILDEPSGGLSPQATQALVNQIVEINESGTSIIWVVVRKSASGSSAYKKGLHDGKRACR